jgi:hypothetical protein
MSYLVFIQSKAAPEFLSRVTIAAFGARMTHSLVFRPFLDGHAFAATCGRYRATMNRAQAVRRVPRQCKRSDRLAAADLRDK